MIQQIKELRVKIDGLSKLTKGLKPFKISADVDMAKEENKFYYQDFNSDEIERL